MAKRIVSILVVCVLALSCVFAESANGGIIDVSVSPSAFQWIKVEEDVYRSTSGIAASVGYMKNVWKGLAVGAGIEWSNYQQEKLVPYGSFNNVALLARCGYAFKLSEKVFLDAGIGLGYEIVMAGKNISHSFCSEIDLNMGMVIDDVFSFSAGAKGRAVIQKASQVFSVMPSLSVGITL